MISKDQITAIFCIADDFCKTFIETINQNALPGPADVKIRNKPCKLSDSEVITIMTCFHLSGVRNFKAFYTGYVQKHLQEEFPVTVSYNRFVELSQKAIIPMVLMKSCVLEVFLVLQLKYTPNTWFYLIDYQIFINILNKMFIVFFISNSR